MATTPHEIEPSTTDEPFHLTDTTPNPERAVFEGLSAKAFRHPQDLAAALALNNTKGFETVARALSSAYYERLQNARNLSEFVQVGPTQFGEIHERYLQLASVLSVPRLPDLFVMNSPVAKAETLGVQHPTIRITTELIDSLADDELDTVLAHELGHVKCDHMRYITMAALLRDLGSAASAFTPLPGVGEAAFLGVRLALLEWNRKAEFSCDRAALLAVQKLDPVESALVKLAGFLEGDSAPLDLDALMQQVEGYEEIGAESPFEKAIRLHVLRDQVQHYPVVRIREIREWSTSSQYTAILDRQYELVTEEMWYVADTDDAVGPMTLQELRDALKSGRYTGTDFVFTSGMADWAQAGTVEALAGYCPPVGRPQLPKVPEV